MEWAVAVGIAAVVAGGAVLLVLRRRGRRPAQTASAPSETIAELQRSAGSALVRLDERVRIADDELGFAMAEFGEEEAAPFRAALERARLRLTEAFELNRLLTDAVPEDDTQRRAWADRILTLCRSAESALAEQTAAVASRRAAARRTPAEISAARLDLQRIRAGVAPAREALRRLADRYTDSALLPVAENPAEAERLLDFASRSLAVAESRVAASRNAEAAAAVRAATETARRAEGLLAAVDRFEIDAVQAESTLAAMITESREELAAARALPEKERHGAIDRAVAGLEEALAALPRPGDRMDPVASLSAVREANTALDDVVAQRVERAERRERLRTQLVTAIDDAERQIATARGLVWDYGASIGPDARTRLAAAERDLAGLTEERDPEAAIARARRAASTAADAAASARADLERGTPGRPLPGARSAPAMLGGVLGGLALGSLLDDLGDVGDLFD